MSLSSTTNLPTDTGIVLVIDRVNSSGTATPTSREYVKGTVSGSNIINLVRGVGNSTAQAHSTGAVVEQVVDQTTVNDLMDGLLVEHNQDGTHSNVTGTTAVFSGNVTAANFVQTNGAAANGWTVGLATPNTITYNGNRSYTCVFNSVDLTGTLSNGQRLLFSRSVAAPSQCTSLNGTTQYYSKSSPAGMTFTDDFTCSAWIKLSSYATASIISRYNGTSGWDFQVTSSGQIVLGAFNAGSGNTSYVQSYQSVPLNKWVHVQANLDMSAFTTNTDGGASGSTIAFDGVNVPSQVLRAGTNPTALVQAGNLEIGSRNGGTNTFPGKIAQAAVFSSKITIATMRSYISQGLAGNEPNCISAYSFNNSINDLNTTNANNLTANGSAVATNADSPFAQGQSAGTLEYGIITSNSFSTNTTLTVQVPEGSALPTSGGISAVSYSGVKVPYGFPTQRGKWTIQLLINSDASTSGTTVNTVYNPGGLNIVAPIGSWHVMSDLYALVDTSSTAPDIYIGLSTSSSTFTIPEASLQTRFRVQFTGSTDAQIIPTSRRGYLELSSATPYYILFISTTTFTSGAVRGIIGGSSAATEQSVVNLENAYL